MALDRRVGALESSAYYGGAGPGGPRCPECGGPVGSPSDIRQSFGATDTWALMFAEEFEEEFGELPDGRPVCQLCGYYIDYGHPHEDGAGFRHVYIFDLPY